jgi:hypothetical protein
MTTTATIDELARLVRTTPFAAADLGPLIRAARRDMAEEIAQAIEAAHGDDCYDPMLVCTHADDAAAARRLGDST